VISVKIGGPAVKERVLVCKAKATLKLP